MIAVRGTARRRAARRAFSLVELVMVVTIIGMIASIAVPRVSAGARSANAAALAATLGSVRTAIDAYYAEHGKYPGYVPGTDTPDGARFVNQLLMYSDAKGDTKPTYGGAYVFGPYLRAPFPTTPINKLSTVHVKAKPGDADPAAGTVGWIAVFSHGYFGISATDPELDQVGVRQADKQQLRTQ